MNAARRTGRDLLTLIPFTIILLIPLSPVGHVLVFNFIQVCLSLFSTNRNIRLQRFFPDFFPSCYTEKRLNLLKLYSEIERKSEDELLGLHLLDDDKPAILRQLEEKKPLVLLACLVILAVLIL